MVELGLAFLTISVKLEYISLSTRALNPITAVHSIALVMATIWLYCAGRFMSVANTSTDLLSAGSTDTLHQAKGKIGYRRLDG